MVKHNIGEVRNRVGAGWNQVGRSRAGVREGAGAWNKEGGGMCRVGAGQKQGRSEKRTGAGAGQEQGRSRKTAGAGQ